MRLDPETLRQAMRFAKVYLVARDLDADLEKHPNTILAAYHVVETLGKADEADLLAVMGRMAAKLRGDDDDIGRKSDGRTGAANG